MPTLTGTLAEITGAPIDPDSLYRVTVRAPSRRASLADQERLVSSVPVPVEVSAGGVISVDLEPGPAILLVEGEGYRDPYELGVTEDMTLLTEAIAESAPSRTWVESNMVQLRAEAVTAAADALEAAIATGQDRSEIEALRAELVEAAENNVAPHLTQTALNNTYGTKAELAEKADASVVETLDADKLDKAEAADIYATNASVTTELDARAEPLIVQAVNEANAQIQSAVNDINPIVQWPKNAIGGAHLDTMKTPGQYWQDTKSVTTTANGYPFYDTCSLQVFSTSASDSQSVTQVVIGKETRQIGVRDCVAGTWSSWTVYSNVAIQLGATDLNTLTTGQTRLATVSAETGAPNMPANRRAVIRVFGNGASVTQRVYALQTPEVWTRSLYGGTWSAWRKDGVAAPTSITVATDANTITESGDYIIVAAAAIAESSNLAVQERQILSVTYEANYRVQTTTSLVTGRKWTRAYNAGTWSAWQQLALASDIPAGVTSTAIDSAGAGMSNDLLVQDWSRRRGGIRKVTTGCVAFRFDHGLAKFDSLIRPLMEARNLPYSLALCSDQWHQPENAGITAATVDGWVQGGLCEVWNHSATHAGSKVEAEWRAQIVDSLVSLRAQIPSAQIDGFAIPGTAGVGYGDFAAGEDVRQFYATPAGRTILSTHAVSTGYIPGTDLRVLDGMIRQGQGHATLDSGTLASAQNKIAQAQAGKRGLQFMLHPNLMDDAGRITASTFEQILDHVVAERDAGRLTVLGPYDLMLARAE